MDLDEPSSSDVEIEEEWEPVRANHASAPRNEEVEEEQQQQQDAEAPPPLPPLLQGGDITITLEPTDTKRGGAAPRTFTREQRAAAALAHRAHALCLLARCVAHDVAACSPDLRAAVLSLLDPALLDTITAAAAREDATDTSWLGALVRWMRATFELVPDSERYGDGGDGGDGGGGGESGAPAPARVRRLLRRGAPLGERLLRCVEARRGTAEELTALLVAVLRALGLLVRTTWAIDAVPFRPAQAEAALMRQLSESSPAPAAQPSGGGPGKPAGGKKRRSSSASAGVAPVSADAAAAADAGPAASGSGSGKSKARGKRREAGSDEAAAAGGGDDGAPAPAEQQQQQRRNRGDEELERQLAMAMAATAAAAEAAAARGGGDDGGAGTAADAAAAGLPPLPPSSGRGALRVLAQRQRASAEAAAAAGDDAGGRGASGSGTSGGMRGRAWAAGVAAAPRCWAEVYIGGSATGRWAGADAVAGWVDTPDAVDRGAARPQPLAYVVAVQAGAPKDVTRRYSANYAAAVKHRDDEWWGATMRALRNPAAHLPPALQAEAAAGLASAAATAAGAAAADDAKRVGGGGGASTSAAAGPSGRRRSAAAVAAAAAEAALAAEAAGDDPAAAALRAAREDAELAHREAAHRRDVPRTIEGFKGHAHYVLKRHIGKYQALAPNARALGIHGGKEPYYDRADVSELHTAERWRREHWRAVRADEVGQPAKVVKKRAAPGSGAAAARARRGSGAMAELDEMAAELDGGGGNGGGGGGNGAGGDNGGEGSGPMTELYGYWQTEPWEPPPAVDGRVPRNERGNVEVPPFARALPRGTRHLRAHGLAGVCRALGVDYAPALAGFDPQGGRMVPRVEGVVVCEEHAQLVLDAAEQQRADRALKAARARRRVVERAWLQLLRTLWRRVQMDRGMAADAEAGVGVAGAAELTAAAAAAAAASGGKTKKRGGGNGDGDDAAAAPRRARTAKDAVRALEQEQAAGDGGGGAQVGGGGGDIVDALEQHFAGRKRARVGGGGGGGGNDLQPGPDANGNDGEEEDEGNGGAAGILDGVNVEEF